MLMHRMVDSFITNLYMLQDTNKYYCYNELCAGKLTIHFSVMIQILLKELSCKSKKI